MIFAPRYYQTNAEDAFFDYVSEHGTTDPLFEMATGTGKSVVIARIIQRILTEFDPTTRILMLVHVKELVAQNAQALVRAFPGAPIGINSAGLGKRDFQSQVLFASIQSVFRAAKRLGKRRVVMIDECHLLPPEGEGMYRKLLDELRAEDPQMRVVGFTATPYRTGFGRLDGPGALFDRTIFTYDLAQGIADGFLCPLISKATLTGINLSGVAKRGGEFVEGALQAAMDVEDVTERAADEILALGANRRSWLAFCSGVAHAQHVRDAIASRGIECGVITGETPAGERDAMIRAFKAGKLRALTNANVLTTGFDAPGLDFMAFLRPTLSTSLYVQMAGRGTRCLGKDMEESLANGKANCLVADFAGNVRRHGPVDAIRVRSRKAQDDDDGASVKEASVKAKQCPECQSLVGLATQVCPVCEHEWPVRSEGARHDATADGELSIMGGVVGSNPWREVSSFKCFENVKQYGPPKTPTMRVEYLLGHTVVMEWVCFQHPETSFAYKKAKSWWKNYHGKEPVPQTIDEAVQRANAGEIAMPSHVVTKQRDEYQDVIGRKFSDEEKARAQAAPRHEYKQFQVPPRIDAWDGLDEADDIPF